MAIRTKTHKLIYFYGCDYEGKNQTPPAWELYDLSTDPNELTNLYGNPEYSKIQNDLKSKLEQIRADIGDDGSHYPNCERVVQEFWDYSEADQRKAIQISSEFRQKREKMLLSN